MVIRAIRGLKLRISFLNQVFLYGATFLVEVDADHVGGFFIERKRQQILPVLYLLKGFLCRAVEFELHDIAVQWGLYQQVYAAVAGLVFRVAVEAEHLEHHPHNILVVVLAVHA